jgi:hypothetical protein
MVTYAQTRLMRLVAALTFAFWTLQGRFGLLLREQMGAVGDVTFAYTLLTAPTVTNLHSLASSQTWVAGWESNAIDNTTTKYADFIINVKLVRASANLQVGEHRMYLVATLDDGTTWPDVFDGTESVETINDTEQRDAICKLAAVCATDTGNGETDYLMCPSVATIFGGMVPPKFVIFITSSGATSTNAALAASGNVVYATGVKPNVAQT